MKPQLQLSAGQNPTITSVTNHTNENENSVTAPVSTDSNKTNSNMEGIAEPFKNGANASTSNGSNHNGAVDIDVNLESEERDEFIDIKVSLEFLLEHYSSNLEKSLLGNLLNIFDIF